MKNIDIIQCSIDYIEENLKTEITAEELSQKAGYSLFHYYKIFQSIVGMPVMQYITRRKLLNAIYEIGCGCKMIDVALKYEFDTYAGFYKAFRHEFHISPSQYLKKHKAKKPYRINLYREEDFMITQKKIKGILKHWNFENEKITDIYYDGTDNRNEHAFYIGDDYVLKFTANLGQLTSHISISKALKKAGFNSSTPIPATDGKEYIIDGELYVFLTNRMKGNQMNSTTIFDDAYEEKGRFIGEIVGQLHLILAQFDTPVNDTNLLVTIKDWALPKAKIIMNLTEGYCNDFLSSLENMYPKLKKQIIHRDPNPGNIIVDGEHFGFIDFDLAERNIRIYDPCYASTAILSETINDADETKFQKWIDIYKNIIYGYDSVAKLSETEKIAIPYIIMANQLICCAWFSEQEKYQEQYKSNLKMTKWIVDNFDKLIIK